MTTYQLLQLLPERRDVGSGVDELLAEIDATSFAHRRPAERRDATSFAHRRPAERRNGFVEAILDRIADGEVIMPTSYLDLTAAIRQGRAAHEQWERLGAPAHILQNLRSFITTAAWMLQS